MIRKIYCILIFLFSIVSLFLGFNAKIIPNLFLYILIGFYFINLILLYLLIGKKRKKGKNVLFLELFYQLF